MPVPSWTIRDLRRTLATGDTLPSELAEVALARSNRNGGRNVYLWQDPAWTRAEAARIEAMPRASGGIFGDGRAVLWGVPISVKDCFDLAGAVTTCGSHYFRDRNGISARDSWLVEQLRTSGAVIIGKTNLHAMAYGITGENPEFGDCVQPRDAGALTGGSSSGAAASVQEGSALAAIGTDTGGSVRVPAALCGLAGYRSTLGRGDWRGGAHLAESFDTLGWLFRDLEDAPLLTAPFAPADAPQARPFTRFAFVSDSFLHDCESEVAANFHQVVRNLQALGLQAHSIDTDWWKDSVEIFAPLQASEAAQLYADDLARSDFLPHEPSIRERLKWGASFSPDEIAARRRHHADFRARMDDLFARYELVLLPCAPVARLQAKADHSQTRAKLLRYTSPFSLAGVPAITIPCAQGAVQVAAARGNDESLLQLAANYGKHTKASATQ